MDTLSWIVCVAMYIARRLSRLQRYSPEAWTLIEAARELKRLNAERKGA